MAMMSSFAPGDQVLIADGIPAVVEEVIFARGMDGPFLLVEYWFEGSLRNCRVHSEDVRRPEREGTL